MIGATTPGGDAVGIWGRMRALAVGTLATALLGGGVAQAQQCVSDYERTLEALKKPLGICAQHNKLMSALTDAPSTEFYGEGSPNAARPPGQPGWLGIDTGHFTRRSDPDFKFVEPRPDPAQRWQASGNKLYFNCHVPLSSQPMPQNEAFLECARVYACARATASCGIATARRTGSRDCKGITEQCLASHPIPQGQMAAVVAEQPRSVSPGGSSPRTPPAAPSPTASLSPQCKAQLNQFLQAADQGDSAKATAAYESLRANCDGAMRQLAQAADVTLPERQMGRLSRRSFGDCLQGIDCGTAPSTPQQTAQAAANAFNIDEVMAVAFSFAGLAVGIAGVSGMYMPVAGGQIMQSNRFTTINDRARSTYGQGGPGYVAPRTVPSDITGTKR